MAHNPLKITSEQAHVEIRQAWADSYSPEAIERAVDGAKKAGAKRAIVLAVSIAAHSELMRSAIEEFRAAVSMTPLRAPRVPIVSNVSA